MGPVNAKSWNSSPWLVDSRIDTPIHLEVRLHKIYMIKFCTTKRGELMVGLMVPVAKGKRKTERFQDACIDKTNRTFP